MRNYTTTTFTLVISPDVVSLEKHFSYLDFKTSELHFLTIPICSDESNKIENNDLMDWWGRVNQQMCQILLNDWLIHHGFQNHWTDYNETW